MSYNLGSAYIEVVPSMKGLKKAVEDPLAASGDRASGGLSDALFKGLKWGAVGAAGAITGTIGTALVKGFGRLSSIENAEAKLRGLGYSAKDVTGIMDSALKSVKGTAFGLDQAAGLAGTLTAAGIKPGKDLEKTLSLVGDSATIAGRDLGDMGLIWASVASKGKLQGDDAMQLLESGIPIWQMVGKQMGITAGEAQELGSKGQVSFEIFQKAMQDGVGGAALESGKTVQGAFKNMGAALSRFGAGMLKGVYPLIAPMLGGITQAIDSMSAVVGPWTERMSTAFGSWLTDTAVPALKDFAGSLKAAFDLLVSGDFKGGIFGLSEDSPVIGALFTIREAAISLWEKALVPLGGFIRDNLVPILAGLVSSGIVAGISALVGAIGAAVTAAGGFGAVLAGVLAPLASAPVLIGAAVGAITWFFTATEAGKGVIDGIVGVLGGLWSALQVIVTGDFKGGIFGLSEDNPIIGALLTMHDVITDVGGAIQTGLIDGWNALTKAWQTGDTGGNPVLDILVKIRDIGSGVWDKITSGIDTVKGALSSLGGSGSDGLSRFMGALSWVGQQVGGYFSGIWGLLSGIGSFVAQVVSGVILPALLDLWGILSGTIIPIVVKLFSEYVGPALAAIGAAVLWLYGNVLGPTLSAIGWLLTNVLGPAFTWLYGTVISPAINAIGAVISFVFNTIVFPVLDAVKRVLVEGLPVAARFLWSVMTTVWGGIQSAIEVVGTWITGTLVPALQAAWTAISTAALWLWQSVIVPVWEGIKVAIVMAAAVIMTIVQGLVWLWQNVLAPAAMWVYQSIILPVWNAIQVAISAAIGFVKLEIQGLVLLWQNYLAPALLWLYNSVVLPVWNAIKAAIGAVVSWFQNTAWPLISTVINLITVGFNVLKDSLSYAWAWIRFNVINPVIVWMIGTAWPLISSVIDNIKRGFDIMKNAIGDAWSWVKDHGIKPVADWLQNTLKPNIDNVTGGIKSAFDVMKDGIASAWDKVREAARAPIDFVINKVYNEGLKDNFNKVAGDLGVSTRLPPMTMPKGFARGGILPGFSRERDGDDQLVPMRRGEGVLVSEGLRDTASRAAFLAANAAARRGVSFAQYMGGGFAAGGIVPGFAGGGILDKVKRTAGGIWDWVADGADLVTEVLGDPAGALKKLIQGSVDLIPGEGIWKDAAKAIPTKIIDGISSMIGSAAQAVPDMAPGAGAAAGFGGGRGGSLGAAEALAVRMGLRITSRGRRGARTAQNGLVSLHALGRAIDVAGPNMMGYFNAIDAAMSPTELLYSPAGGRNKHRSGRRGPNTGATLRNHYSHVHVGFAGGGIVPSLFDQGGRLDPGVHVVANKTRRPETILPAAESRALTQIAAQRGDGGGIHYHYEPTQVDLEGTVEARMRREYEAMIHEARRVVGV